MPARLMADEPSGRRPTTPDARTAAARRAVATARRPGDRPRRRRGAGDAEPAAARRRTSRPPTARQPAADLASPTAGDRRDPQPAHDARRGRGRRATRAARRVAPRTVGRFIADALRRGRRALRLHRARRELPRPARGPPRRPASGSSRPATRAAPRSWPRRTASSPAGRRSCLGTRAVGAAEPRDRDPHGAGRLDADVRARRPGRARATAAARRSRRSTWSATIGRLAKWAAEIDRPGPAARRRRRRRPRQALGGRPGPASSSVPEDVLDELVPGATGRRLAPPSAAAAPGARRRPRPSSSSSPARRAAGDPRRRRRPPRARTSTDLVRLAELLEVPVIAVVAARRRVPERPSAVPRDDRLRRARRRSASGSRRPTRSLVLGCRLNEITSFEYAIPDAGQRWAHVDLEPRRRAAGLPAPDLAIRGRRPGLPAGGRRAAPGGRPRRGRSLDARRPRNEADRAAWEAATVVDDEALGRPGRPSRPASSATPDAVLPRRRDRHHGRRQLRRLGGPRLPLPPARARSSGRRPARWATGCRPRSPRRSSIPTGRSSRSPATAASR